MVYVFFWDRQNFVWVVSCKNSVSVWLFKQICYLQTCCEWLKAIAGLAIGLPLPAFPPAPLPGSPMVINTPSSWSPKTDKDNNAAFMDNNNNKMNKTLVNATLWLSTQQLKNLPNSQSLEIRRTQEKGNSRWPLLLISTENLSKGVSRFVCSDKKSQHRVV